MWVVIVITLEVKTRPDVFPTARRHPRSESAWLSHLRFFFFYLLSFLFRVLALRKQMVCDCQRQGVYV